MKRVTWIALTIAVLAVAWFVWSAADTARAADEKTLYTCSMHPEVVQDEPGTCPICHMDLVPLKPTNEPVAPDAATDAEPSPKAAGAVRIDPVMVQNMGVRLEHVQRDKLRRNVRTLGEIDVAEDALGVVNLRFSGWIEKIHVDKTGAAVRRGQSLFRIYSPELLQAQEEYLQVAKSVGPDSDLTASARTKLDLLIGGAWLSKRLDETGEAMRSVTIPSPQSGFVLHKNVVQGSKVAAGADLYTIGNLAKIWVTAEVYEFDAPWIAAGQTARLELPFQQGRRLEGKVDYVYPTLDPQTRTLRARLVFPNPGVNLKPGMFATVWIDVEEKPQALVVPTEAILHSGERQLVFVSLGGGRFAPRDIVTGMEGDDHRTEVLSGLEENEVVVVSGQFLLDSESQLQEAVNKLLDARLAAKQADAQPADEHAGHDHDAAGETYWTCPMHPEIVQDGPGTCPICHMDLVEKKR